MCFQAKIDMGANVSKRKRTYVKGNSKYKNKLDEAKEETQIFAVQCANQKKTDTIEPLSLARVDFILEFNKLKNTFSLQDISFTFNFPNACKEIKCFCSLSDGSCLLAKHNECTIFKVDYTNSRVVSLELPVSPEYICELNQKQFVSVLEFERLQTTYKIIGVFNYRIPHRKSQLFHSSIPIENECFGIVCVENMLYINDSTSIIVHSPDGDKGETVFTLQNKDGRGTRKQIDSSKILAMEKGPNKTLLCVIETFDGVSFNMLKTNGSHLKVIFRFPDFVERIPSGTHFHSLKAVDKQGNAYIESSNNSSYFMDGDVLRSVQKELWKIHRDGKTEKIMWPSADCAICSSLKCQDILFLSEEYLIIKTSYHVERW